MTTKITSERLTIARAQTNQSPVSSPSATDKKVEQARLQHLSTSPSPSKATPPNQIFVLKQPRPGF